MIPFTLTQSSLTVLINGIPKVVDKTHVNLQKIIEAVTNGDEEAVLKFSDVSTAVVTFGEGKIEVKDGAILYKGEEVHNYVADKIFEFMSEGLPVTPLVNFLSNLMDNPSYRAVQELYKFLEVGGMPLTEDGHFLAYKKIRNDFKDIHSGTFDNSVGKICEMPRNQVDENSSVTCSRGLHVCSYGYLSHFGGYDSRVVICKINPRDVVSIPQDYNNTKMRLCRYEVIQDVTEQYLGKDLLRTTVYSVPTERAVGQFSLEGKLIKQFVDTVTAEKATGVWSQNILKCLRGERQSAGGFKWDYV